MRSFASCFKRPEAKSSMEMKAFLLLAEEGSKVHQQGQEPLTMKSCVKSFCCLELNVSSKMFP